MANLNIDPEELRPLVREIIELVLSEGEHLKQLLNGKLAITEPDAAALLGLNPWQLRDLRLAGKITHSRIVGGRIRYTHEDLTGYLCRSRATGNNARR